MFEGGSLMYASTDFILREASKELRELFDAPCCSVQQFHGYSEMVLGSPVGVTTASEGSLGRWVGPRKRNQSLFEMRKAKREIQQMRDGLPVVFDCTRSELHAPEFDGFFEEVSVLGIPFTFEGSLVAMGLVRVNEVGYHFDEKLVRFACRIGRMAAVGIHGAVLSQALSAQAVVAARQDLSEKLSDVLGSPVRRLVLEVDCAKRIREADGMTYVDLDELGCLAEECSANLRALTKGLEDSHEPLSMRPQEEKGRGKVDDSSAALDQPGRFAGLTPREFEVLAQMAVGLTNKEIGDKLFLSVNTIKKHVQEIMLKFEAKNRTEAVAKARALHIL